MKVSYATIASRCAELHSAEAAGLVLEAAQACDRGRRRGRSLPPADRIVLSRRGAVSLLDSACIAPEGQRVAALAALLRVLLGIDSQPAGVSRADVPGPLMLLMARTAGEIDLPAPSYAEFLDVLRRYAVSDRRSFSAIYRRCAPPQPFAWTRVAEPLAASLLVAAAAGAFLTVAGVRQGPSLFEEREGAAATVLEENAAAVPARSLDPEQTPEPAVGAGSRAAARGQAPVARAAIRAEGPVIVTAVPLLSSSDVGADVFSPSFVERDELLFHAGRSRSALMRASFGADGRPAVETILADGAANYHAVPSPDGQAIAFDSDREGTRGVYVANADGSGVRRISGDGYAAVPRWSPDGRRLAFIKADPGRLRVWNVWVAEVASGELRQVSRHRVGQAWGASWFPDGERLAYSVEEALVVSDLGTGARWVFQSPRKGRLVRTPAVSPDGARIVFQVHRDGVWMLEMASGQMQRVLRDPAAEEFAWSPDGSQIAFHTRRGGAWSLWQFSFTRS